MPRVSLKAKYIVQSYELFKNNGINLSMEEIAKGLNLTKKTLYNNFDSKEDLIKTVIDYFFSGIEKKIISSLDNSSNAIEALFKVSYDIQEEIETLGLGVINEMSHYKSKIQILDHTNRMSFYSRIIRDNLERGIREGLYREDLDIEYTTLFYTCVIEKFYKWEGEYKYMGDSNQFHTQLVMHHLQSVVNTKGREVLNSYCNK